MSDSLWHDFPVDRRIMAHTIMWRGHTYTMHIAALTPTGEIRLISYDGEEWGVTFINGSITLRVTPSGWQYRPIG